MQPADGQPAPLPRRRERLAIVLAAGVILPAGAVTLYLFPPATSTFYPRCYFYALTGLYCPGCGATRCLHAL